VDRKIFFNAGIPPYLCQKTQTTERNLEADFQKSSIAEGNKGIRLNAAWNNNYLMKLLKDIYMRFP